jgi:Uma2 family endonuclease
MLSAMTEERRLPTFDELYRRIEALPEGITGEILERGKLRTMSRPGSGHRRAAQLCNHYLQRFDPLRGGKGWWIEVEAEIRFPQDRLLVPDVAGWCVERVPQMPTDNPLLVLPDWACEILSPSTANDDRRLKLPLYASAGVAWIWLVDPSLRLVEVFESVGGRATLAASATGDETGVLPPFDEPVSLAAWWADEEPVAAEAHGGP